MHKWRNPMKVKNGDWQDAKAGRVKSVEGWDVEFYYFLAHNQMKSFVFWCELELKRYPLETRKALALLRSANNRLYFSALSCGLFWRTEWPMAQFCQNADVPPASTTITLERAHARPHSRWENVFAKLIKKVSDGNDKKIFAIRMFVANIKRLPQLPNRNV